MGEDESASRQEDGELCVKSENPAQTTSAETKTTKKIQLPADDQNNDDDLMDCVIKAEPEEVQAIEVVQKMPSTQEQPTMAMKRDAEDVGESADVKRLKTEPSESVRRRSLRNETAATIKKKPPKYEEIFNCYKRKEYKECIIYLELVSEAAKDCIEYLILKAACLIHLGIKISEAHKILDDVLKLRPDNVFTIYAKGLAHYHEQRWSESIKYFERSLELDKSSMQRAEVMMRMAKEQLEKANLEQEKMSIPTEGEAEGDEEDEEFEEENNEELETVDSSDSGDEAPEFGETKHERNIRNKRFGCELCGKYFGKKYNLDRHNKSIHNRDTPFIAPLPRHQGRKSSPAEDEGESISSDEEEQPIKMEEEEVDDYEDIETEDDLVDIPMSSKKKHKKFKIRLGGGSGKSKVTKAASLPSLAPLKTLKPGLARCKICKKAYRKGSLARHEIIHTGNKPHKCDQCSMAFYQKSDLQRHLTIHSDNFDFECELCDKKFRIKKNLQVHNKRHHSNVV